MDLRVKYLWGVVRNHYGPASFLNKIKYKQRESLMREQNGLADGMDLTLLKNELKN